MVYLSYNAPHAPLQATQKYLDRFPNIIDKKRKTYAAMVSAMDDGIGRVLNTLRKQNIEENTIVVFLSDNGGAHGLQKVMTASLPIQLLQEQTDWSANPKHPETPKPPSPLTLIGRCRGYGNVNSK